MRRHWPAGTAPVDPKIPRTKHQQRALSSSSRLPTASHYSFSRLSPPALTFPLVPSVMPFGISLYIFSLGSYTTKQLEKVETPATMSSCEHLLKLAIVHRDPCLLLTQPAVGGLIVVDVDALKLEVEGVVIAAGWVDAVLVPDHLPKFGADLVTALAALDMKDCNPSVLRRRPASGDS